MVVELRPREGLIYAAARDVTDRREAERGCARRGALPAVVRGLAARHGVVGRAAAAASSRSTTRSSTSRACPARSSWQRLAPSWSTSTTSVRRDGLERLERGELRSCGSSSACAGSPAGALDGLHGSIVRGEDDEPLYRISRLQDIDARRRGQEQLRHLADHDTLSGLFNRRRFHEELARELLAGGRGAVLLFDLDNFKAVNDTLGHAAGDAVIQRVGHALSARLRTSDVSARLGGDEFGVILRRVRAEEADRVALELLDQVQGAIESEPDGAGVSLSLGVAPFEGTGLEPDELLRAADAAMYQAKSRGGAIARAT